MSHPAPSNEQLHSFVASEYMKKLAVPVQYTKDLNYLQQAFAPAAFGT